MLETHFKREMWYCVLQPNHSISWQQCRRVVIALAVLSMLIAGFWALQGAWLILPFAGIEVALVYVLLRRVCARVHRQEVLEVDEAAIRLSWGREQPEGVWEGARRNTQLVCWRPVHAWSPPRLQLRCAGRTQSLARECNKEDCEALIAHWQALALPITYVGETRIRPYSGFDNEE